MPMKFILSHAIVPEAMQLLDGCEAKVLNTRDMAENMSTPIAASGVSIYGYTAECCACGIR